MIHPLIRSCLACLALLAAVGPCASPAAERDVPVASEVAVPLQAPLTTVVAVRQPLDGHEQVISARVLVPDDAPADLGVGAFVADRHGRWFQRLRPGVLGRGMQTLEFRVGGDDDLLSEPCRLDWSPSTASTAHQGGLFFWSASGSRARLRIFDLGVRPAAATAPAPRAGALRDLELDRLSPGGEAAQVAAGTRWTLRLRPEPFPANPFDPDQFALDAVITTPDGGEERVPGFYVQDMGSSDRGDREQLTPEGEGRFAVRYRPRQPGRHHLRLEASWGKGKPLSVALPDLVVDGPRWDGFVRIDAKDPRFFSIDGGFYWPLGPNLRSVNDTRGQDRLHTVFTPDRGSYAYEAYLRRLAANGVSAVEIWMSSWNLALEWRGDWPGFYGQGRYNQDNAWRLDRILDLAARLGVHVNLVINNHGQASPSNDAEWPSNPYNRQRGGRLTEPQEFFTDPYAIAGQDHLRRYIVARYADHPAIIGWKMWSEVNLTAGRGEALRRWHEQAANRWHELDVYHHGVSSHWCGDYHVPDRGIVALPSLDYVCIDAYHGPDRLLAELLYNSTMDPNPGRGLAQFGKPLLTTEFGCNWDAGPDVQMEAEHASGPWAALVSGHAGAPMLWWFEWLDQRDAFAPYRALSRFLAGEDLRGIDARSIILGATSASGRLWSRAWSRPGRMLGYVLDAQWGQSGEGDTSHDAAQIQIGSSIGAGTMIVEWWDADAGAWHKQQTIVHPGGALALAPPPFKRHLAFKLYRQKPSG
jgi:hypothetical protein